MKLCITRETLSGLYETERLSMQGIAQIYKVSPTTVHAALIKLGIPRRPMAFIQNQQKSKLYSVTREELSALYEKEGLSLTEIGVHYGVSASQISKRMIRFSIPRRPADGSGQIGKGKLGKVSREELDDLYNHKQMSVGEIGKKYHTSETSIYRKMDLLGLSRREYKRELTRNWHGGRQRCSKGYVKVLLNPDDSLYSMTDTHGYIFEHRLVMAKHLGRLLLRYEQVHHKGTKYPQGSKEDKADNRIENLELMPNPGSHTRMSACSHCELKKEIRLLHWQIKEQGEQIKNLTRALSGLDG